MDKKLRYFDGKLNVFVDYKEHPEDRVKRNFEKKHLKAYLRGDRRFSFGIDAQGLPVYYIVKEVWR